MVRVSGSFQWLELDIFFLFKENTFSVHDDLSESNLVLQALYVCVCVCVCGCTGLSFLREGFLLLQRAGACSLVAVSGLLIVVASFVAEHRL